jgi:hypothetical protein
MPLDPLTFAALFQEDFASQRCAHPVSHKWLTAVHAIEHEQSVPVYLTVPISSWLDYLIKKPRVPQTISTSYGCYEQTKEQTVPLD